MNQKCSVAFEEYLYSQTLSDLEPKSHRQIAESTGLKGILAHNALHHYRKKRLNLSTDQQLYEHERIFKGNVGPLQTIRPYNLCLLKPEDKETSVIDAS